MSPGTPRQQGDQLGAAYRFLNPIGSGSMGDVWTVSGPDKTVYAAKMLRPEHSASPDLVERFVRERSLLVGLHDAHIVEVHDLVIEGDQLGIVMDYMQGGSLRNVLETTPTLAPAQALEVCAQALDALASAHEQRVVHRDVKPDNILLPVNWPEALGSGVKVSDFGVAALVEEGSNRSSGVLGTPLYMAPEHVTTGESGAAGDVYSVGIVLYELLAGHTPFSGPGTDFTVAFRHVNAVPAQLDVPPPLQKVLDTLLAKAPGSRPTAAQAARLLRRTKERTAGTAALAPAPAPTQFTDVARPATVVRGLSPEETPEPEAIDPAAGADEPQLPDLGPGGSATVARPLRSSSPVATPGSVKIANQAATKQSFWRRYMPWILGGVAALMIVSVVIGFTVWKPHDKKKEPPKASVQNASVRDDALPTGLTLDRRVTSSETGSIELTLTYSAEKAPLRGDFLEVLPGMTKKDECPAVTWDGDTAAKNQPSVTGVDTPCAWTINDIDVPAGDSIELKATVDVAPKGDEAADKWLRKVSGETTAAVSEAPGGSTSFAVQRLQDIDVITPDRVVTSSPVRVTVLPDWGKGPDRLHPLYVSPAKGDPSQMLTDVAGGEDGVRFSDGCSGALTVDRPGLTVTALQISPKCTLRARIGNFIDLESNEFSVSSREAD